MPNAPHVLETALLLLVAFLIGCVAGYLARRLASVKQKPAEAAPTVQNAAPPSGPQLVVAPTIAPVAGSARRPAARLAAAAAREAEPERAPALAQAAPLAEESPLTSYGQMRATVKMPEIAPLPDFASAAKPVMRPAHVAGEATSGLGVPAPIAEAVAPAVVPEPPEAPVRAEDVPPIDEAAHVVEPVMASAAAVEEPARIEPVADEDAEIAAMRAVEGGWTPRGAAAPSRPVPLPEPVGDGVDAAMETARSAVAAATAAAVAVIGEQDEPAPPAPEPAATPQPLRHGFGRPGGLPAPRDGQRDNLRQIKGIAPAVETSLNELGIFHYDQIAGWDQKAVVWIENHLGLKGRIARDKWLEQARDLGRGRSRPVRPVRR